MPFVLYEDVGKVLIYVEHLRQI